MRQGILSLGSDPGNLSSLTARQSLLCRDAPLLKVKIYLTSIKVVE